MKIIRTFIFLTEKQIKPLRRKINTCECGTELSGSIKMLGIS
jgi:hypothetical protein